MIRLAFDDVTGQYKGMKVGPMPGPTSYRDMPLDNVFTERLWRSLKYEDIYRRGYENVADLRIGLTEYFAFYNGQRPHASLAYQTPKEVHFESIRLTEVAA
jgi:transposase InsO family protein